MIKYKMKTIRQAVSILFYTLCNSSYICINKYLI